MRAIHIIGDVAAFLFLGSILGVLFLFRGRKTFEIVDNFLEHHYTAEIERERYNRWLALVG